MTTPVQRHYPRTQSFGTADVELRLMTTADGPALADFMGTLPNRELMFVNRDLTHPKVIAAWLKALEQGRLTSLVAYHNGELVGCTAIVVDNLSWSRHVGELRVISDSAWRGRGLGRWLIQESFAIALGLGLEKLTVQMTVDQRAAIGIFEELGFHAEAVLQKHVKDHDGQYHDLAVLSHDVAGVQSLIEVLGLTELTSH